MKFKKWTSTYLARVCMIYSTSTNYQLLSSAKGNMKNLTTIKQTDKKQTQTIEKSEHWNTNKSNICDPNFIKIKQCTVKDRVLISLTIIFWHAIIESYINQKFIHRSCHHIFERSLLHVLFVLFFILTTFFFHFSLVLTGDEVLKDMWCDNDNERVWIEKERNWNMYARNDMHIRLIFYYALHATSVILNF